MNHWTIVGYFIPNRLGSLWAPSNFRGKSIQGGRWR